MKLKMVFLNKNDGLPGEDESRGGVKRNPGEGSGEINT